jgi:arylsulfatase B
MTDEIFSISRKLRLDATINCPEKVIKNCDPREKVCLFNIDEDPCELNDLSLENPEILREMLSRLAIFNATAVPPANLPVDEKGDPKYWAYTFTNFGDFL